MTRRLLAIDAGTTGVTSLLFDEGFGRLAHAYREFPQIYPRSGWVEHEATAILGALDATLDELAAGDCWGAIDAVGITNQRETVFALERSETGPACPIGNGIVWQDRRTADRCAELREGGHEQRLREITGLVLDPYFSGTKIEWLLQEREGVAKAGREGRLGFATVDALIVDHLTRGNRWVTEPTNASRTLLYDIDQQGWSGEMCELFGVDAQWLPEVLPSVSDFGTARLPGGLEAPIHGMAGDQQAALFGQGCFERGSFKNTYGTGCFLVLNTGDTRVDSKEGLLTTLAVGSDGGVVYALEGSVFSGGLVIQWLRDGLGILEEAAASEELARSVDDSGGVVLVPAFSGLGVPWWDPHARAALLGLSRGSTRAHIARAALESIALQCTDVVEVFRRETGLAVESLRVDGGAAANDLMMQMQADFAGLEVIRPAELESTARGAAALAAVGLGLAVEPKRVSAVGETRFQPALGAQARRHRLQEWHVAVRRVLSDSVPNTAPSANSGGVA